MTRKLRNWKVIQCSKEDETRRARGTKRKREGVTKGRGMGRRYE